MAAVAFLANYLKTATFNGVKRPDIAIQTSDNQIRVVRRFGYDDYRNRLS